MLPDKREDVADAIMRLIEWYNADYKFRAFSVYSRRYLNEDGSTGTQWGVALSGRESSAHGDTLSEAVDEAIGVNNEGQ